MGGGNCYALTFDSDDGRIRAGVIVDGAFTDFLSGDPLYAPTSGWRTFEIDCYGSRIKYLVDDETLVSVTDTTHSHGRFGIGYHEYFATDSNAQGTNADGFAMRGLQFDPDGDGDLDLDDYAVFAGCMNGPQSEFPAGDICLLFDGDGDQNVDLADFRTFQAMFTGAR